MTHPKIYDVSYNEYDEHCPRSEQLETMFKVAFFSRKSKIGPSMSQKRIRVQIKPFEFDCNPWRHLTECEQIVHVK